MNAVQVGLYSCRISHRHYIPNDILALSHSLLFKVYGTHAQLHTKLPKGSVCRMHAITARSKNLDMKLRVTPNIL